MAKNKKKANTAVKINEEAIQNEELEDDQTENQLKSITNGHSIGKEDEDKVKQLEEKISELTLKLEEKEKDVRQPTNDNNEIELLKAKLNDTEAASQQHKASYEALLSRLSSMKSIFSKMKEAQIELEECKGKLEESETEKSQLLKKLDIFTEQNEQLSKSMTILKEETTDLNNECDRLTNDLSRHRREYQTHSDSLTQEKEILDSNINKLTIKNEELKSTIQEYLILLEENKVTIQNMGDQIEDLTNALTSKEQEISDIKDENRSLLTNTENLKDLVRSQEAEFNKEKTILNNQVARVKEEMDIHTSKQNEKLTKLEELQKEIVRLGRFEQESKEKQLQIGKLRHEAIILNEHLTKALKLMKKDVNSDSVDKELVSNLFISFLSLPRGDNKKFEALQLISSFLGWDENKKIAAGLSHKPSSKRGPGETPEIRESFVSLWTDYLEKESNK